MADPARIVEQALVDYFSAFAEGMDVPPARRYFIEGYLQAMIDAGQLTSDSARNLLMRQCERILGEEAAARYRSGDDRVILHSHMLRAPVVPSG